MLKSTIVIAGLLLPIFAGNAVAQSSADLSGRWTITWLSNNSKNPMSLKLTGERFSGTYTNDAKDSCSVSGNLDPASKRLALQIVCPKWDIRIEGRVSANGRLIEGNYQAYVGETGKFTMAKQSN